MHDTTYARALETLFNDPSSIIGLRAAACSQAIASTSGDEQMAWCLRAAAICESLEEAKLPFIGPSGSNAGNTNLCQHAALELAEQIASKASQKNRFAAAKSFEAAASKAPIHRNLTTMARGIATAGAKEAMLVGDGEVAARFMDIAPASRHLIDPFILQPGFSKAFATPAFRERILKAFEPVSDGASGSPSSFGWRTFFCPAEGWARMLCQAYANEKPLAQSVAICSLGNFFKRAATLLQSQNLQPETRASKATDACSKELASFGISTNQAVERALSESAVCFDALEKHLDSWMEKDLNGVAAFCAGTFNEASAAFWSSRLAGRVSAKGLLSVKPPPVRGIPPRVPESAHVINWSSGAERFFRKWSAANEPTLEFSEACALYSGRLDLARSALELSPTDRLDTLRTLVAEAGSNDFERFGSSESWIAWSSFCSCPKPDKQPAFRL